jgi:hypothetical protein
MSKLNTTEINMKFCLNKFILTDNKAIIAIQIRQNDLFTT